MNLFDARIKRITRKLEALLGGSPGERQGDGVLQNVVWLSVDRAWRMMLGFLVGVAVARHLGPAEMGVLVSALALSALAGAVVDLGLDSVLRRELVGASDSRRDELLVTAIAMRAAFIPFGAAALGLGFWMAEPAGGSASVFIALAITLAQPLFSGFDSWFHAQTRARYSVWAQSGAFVLGCGFRILFVTNESPAIAFIWTAVVEGLLVGLLLLVCFLGSGQRIARRTPSLLVAKSLWRDCWPFALINLAALGYQRVDVVMLSAIRGEDEAGLYGIAARLTELGFILPMIIVGSVMPTLARLKTTSAQEYQQRVQHLCTLITWLGIFTATVIMIGGSWFIRLVYGAPYADAGSILMISSWTIVFATQAAARGQWLLLENLQRFGIWYVLIALLLNLSLNLVLIPPFGARGAAAANVLTQACAALIAPALFPATRQGVVFLLNAFVFRTSNPAKN